jgi:hypothetical protein
MFAMQPDKINTLQLFILLYRKSVGIEHLIRAEPVYQYIVTPEQLVAFFGKKHV